jgi:hypothetical protein
MAAKLNIIVFLVLALWDSTAERASTTSLPCLSSESQSHEEQLVQRLFYTDLATNAVKKGGTYVEIGGTLD